MGINNNLLNLYNSSAKGILKMNAELGALGITNYSSPLFMYCWENDYSRAKKKILFVGQETCGWYNCGAGFTLGSVGTLINVYENFNFGSNYYNSPFWNFIHKLNDSINGHKNSFLWTNVNKFGLFEGAGRPDLKVTELENQYFNILAEEIKIVKPDAVVFLTGPNYDWDIVQKLGKTEFIPVDRYSDREFAYVKNKYLPKKAFRIYHPGYLARTGRTNDYLNKLEELIK